MGRGGMGNMQQMMQQAKQMQKKMEEVQAELANKHIEASAGGGVVRATVNGNQELVNIVIEPDAVDPEDTEMLQDMVKAAINEAMKEAKEMSEQAMGGLMGGLPFPPGMF